MKTLTTLTTALAVLLLTATAAGAQYEPQTDLGSYPTTPGATCTLTTANNVSEHPGNVLVIQNGDETFTIEAVEDVHDQSFSRMFTAQADSVSVTVELGPDDPDPDTSVTLTVTCADIPPPVTTTTTPPPPTVPPTTNPPTTQPPPPPTSCVDNGTCHPDTGSGDTTPLAVTLLLGGAALTLTAGAIQTHRTK